MVDKIIIKKYFKFLESGDYKNMITLFSKNAIIFSPLYGKVSATKFYKDLFNDTNKSKIKLINIFSNKSSHLIGYFKYNWTLKNKSFISFYGTDIFSFNKNGKIKEVRIIYDTSPIKESFNNLKN
ncbi:MAG: nuclear transport factor 2 family protein [Candidatus Pacearchaeota archaeon]|jgi:hypothetical protein